MKMIVDPFPMELGHRRRRQWHSFRCDGRGHPDMTLIAGTYSMHGGGSWVIAQIVRMLFP